MFAKLIIFGNKNKLTSVEAKNSRSKDKFKEHVS